MFEDGGFVDDAFDVDTAVDDGVGQVIDGVAFDGDGELVAHDQVGADVGGDDGHVEEGVGHESASFIVGGGDQFDGDILGEAAKLNAGGNFGGHAAEGNGLYGRCEGCHLVAVGQPNQADSYIVPFCGGALHYPNDGPIIVVDAPGQHLPA